MPPRRRSKRLSSDDKEPAAAVGGEDQSPDESVERDNPGSPEKKAARAPSRRRSTREKGGANAVARNALADINRGPDCPIFLLSQELLKKIWEFLDSKTKMTTTVRALVSAPSASMRFSASHPAEAHTRSRSLPPPVRLPAVATALLGHPGAQPQIRQGEGEAHSGRHASGTPFVS